MRWFFPALAFLFVALVLHAQKQPSSKPAVAKPAAQAVSMPDVHDPFENFREFSALKSGGMGQDDNRRIYRSGELMRIDFKDRYHITDLSTRTTWLVYPDSCMKVPFPDTSTYPIKAFPEFEVERVMTPDNETVDGHSCKVENVTYRQKTGGTVVRVKFLEAEDLNGFPVKVELDYGRKDKTIVSYSDVSLKPPDAALFKHPAKCESQTPPGQKPTAVIGVKPEANKAPQTQPQ